MVREMKQANTVSRGLPADCCVNFGSGEVPNICALQTSCADFRSCVKGRMMKTRERATECSGNTLVVVQEKQLKREDPWATKRKPDDP